MTRYERFVRWTAWLLLTVLFAAEPSRAAGAASQAAKPAGVQEPGGAGKGGRLSDQEIGNMAGTLAGESFGAEGDDFGRKIQEALRREAVANNGVRATHVNVRYGDHPRNVFDIWIAPSKKPAPLAVFIHGGGFRRGDKSLLYDSNLLVELLNAGISVAGINYRFSHHSPEGTLGSLKDTARFVQFIRHHAAAYGIDPDRIACYGGSAGGAASLWLGFRDDMAEPGSADPIARESTRLTCAAAMATPATLDIVKWKEILGLSRERVLDAARSFGVKDEAEFYTERGVRLRAETDILEFMSPDDPPVFIHNNEQGGDPRHVGHMAHHPNHAKVLKERADKVGLQAVALGPEIGLNDPAGGNLLSFFTRHLLAPKPD